MHLHTHSRKNTYLVIQKCNFLEKFSVISLLEEGGMVEKKNMYIPAFEYNKYEQNQDK